MPATHLARSSPDRGAGLIDSLVAIALIGTAMTALTALFVSSARSVHWQGTSQTAIHLATSALDRALALNAAAVTGRDRPSSDAQWSAPVAGVANALTDMAEVWDPSATFPSGASAPLPTSPENVVLGGSTYQRSWYIGQCWNPPAGGDCGTIQVTDARPFLRILVAITWPDRRCSPSACSYVTTALIGAAAGEPVFDSGTPTSPQIVGPGDQVGLLGEPVALTLAAIQGSAPLTWSSFGLPPGVTMTSSGQMTGVPTLVGSYPVTVHVVDGLRRIGIATLTWVVS